LPPQKERLPDSIWHDWTEILNNQSITIVDAGTGNIRSVQKAFVAAGCEPIVSTEPRDIQSADKLVLPGVGAFGDFMSGLRQRGCEIPVLDFAHSGRPVLGICVGMQALFDYGEEFGHQAGLGLVAGSVKRFPSRPGIKIPQTGWNQLNIHSHATLFSEINDGDYVYFNHAYYCAPAEKEVVATWTDYGLNFCSSLEMNNLFGVQFHPEKSQRVGLQLLSNFIAL
jgi:glutamine amidotransferase